MPTVICPDKRLAFIHIPKNGGSSVGYQLARKLDCDPRFLGTSLTDHPDLGRYMSSHVPLWAIERSFPDALEALRTGRSFALVRAPRARFVSALSQHLREFRDQDINDIDSAALETVIGEVRAAFDRGPEALLGEYVHFIPQSDFIDLRGERIVDALYPLEALPQMAEELSRLSGVTLTGEKKENTTTHYRSPAYRAALGRFGPVARRLLPRRLFDAARETVRSVAIVKAPSRLSDVLEAPQVDAFLQAAYAADFALHDQLQAGRAA